MISKDSLSDARNFKTYKFSEGGHKLFKLFSMVKLRESIKLCRLHPKLAQISTLIASVKACRQTTTYYTTIKIPCNFRRI